MFTVLRRFSPRNRWTALSLLLFTLALPFVDVALPLFMGASLDGRQGAVEMLIIAALGRFVLQASRRFLSGIFSFHTQHRLRSELFRAVQGVDEHRARALGTGQVISRSISDLNAVQMSAAMLPLLLNSVVELTLITIVVLWISPPVALLIVVFAPLLIWIGYRSRTELYQPTKDVRAQSARVATQVEQTVTGIQVVKSFVQEGYESGRYRTLTRVLTTFQLKLAALNAKFQPALASVPNIALVSTIAVGGWLALNGTISIGEFLSVATYITMLARLARQAASMLVNLHTTQASVDRLLELIDAPQRPLGTLTPSGPLGIHGEVDLGHGTVAVSIEPGSTAVVRGSVASGKTRLAHALAGLNTHDAHALTISSLDGKTGPLLEVREDHRPVIIMDTPFLYSASIRENILLGLDLPDEEVLRATDIACATEFIKELGGFDTVVGERGVTLSGGQRQRIAIARAILRHPGMVIFDDATSAIDHSTEAQILDNLRAAMSEHSATVVYISHRADGGFRNPDVFIDLPSPDPFSAPENSSNEDMVPVEQGNATDRSEPDAAQLTPAPRWAEVMEMPELPADVLATGNFHLRDLFRLTPQLIAAVVVTLLVSATADITLPTFIRHALDRGVAGHDEHELWVICAVALVLVLVSWAASIANTLLTSITGEKLLFALRQTMFTQLTRMDLMWFHRQASGRIMTRLTTDVDTLSSFLQSGLSQAIVSTTMLLGIFGMLVATDLTLSGYVALFLPVIILATVVFRRISRKLYTLARQQISTVNAVFQEALTGLPTGQAYGYGPRLQRRIDEESYEYLRRRTKTQTAVSVYFPAVNGLTYLAQATILAMGAHHDVSSGAVVAFSLYLSLFFTPIQQLSQVFDSYQQASVSLKRIDEFLSISPAITSGDQTAPLTKGTAPTIAFDHVEFSYAAQGAHSASNMLEKPLLQINHEFRGITAIVGETGAGKTTLIRMVNRFIDPTNGAVLVNGCDLRNISLPSWRHAIGTVPQEPHLFEGTVRSNIAYGLHDGPNTTQTGNTGCVDGDIDGDINDALTRISGHEIIKTIPGGLDGHIGEGGQGLSAGQKHIIALARAELLRPAVMLLDEATALIDDAEERAIVKAITTASRGRTTLIIAHRLRTAAMADNIIVMNHGRIVESGTHDELLNRHGQYKRLWDAATAHGSSTLDN